MNAPAKTFGSPSGEPNITTSPRPQQKCEKSWTLPAEKKFPTHQVFQELLLLKER